MSEITPEEALLVAAMSRPELTAKGSPTRYDFQDPDCGAAWEGIAKLHAQGEEMVDPWAITDAVWGQKPPPGKLTWLLRCLTQAPAADLNPEYWKAQILKRAAQRKLERLWADGQAALRKADSVSEKAAIISRLHREARELGKEEDGVETIVDVLRSSVLSMQERMAARAEGRVESLAVPSGVSWLDEMMGGGFPRGTLTILAGRTSHGKSSVAMHCAWGACKARQGIDYYSMEDTAELFGARNISLISGIPVTGNFQGEVDPKQFQRAQEVVEGMMRSGGPANQFGFSARRYTVEELIASVEKRRARLNTGLVVVDYLSLLRLPCKRDKHHEIDDAITRLQEAAIQQNLAYVVLHQLNRSYAGRNNKEPMLSDLRESGSIEERAAAVLFVYRPNVEDGATTQGKPVDDLMLILAKNKFGPRNVARTFEMDFSRYQLRSKGKGQ